MIDDTANGGGEHLAPVTPLFGRRGNDSGLGAESRRGTAENSADKGAASADDAGDRGTAPTAGIASKDPYGYAAPRRVRFTAAEDSAGEDAIRSRPVDTSRAPASGQHRGGPVDRYDADGWWIDPEVDPTPQTAPPGARSDRSSAARGEPRAGTPTGRDRAARIARGTDSEDRSGTPPLMRASDLLKPDDERPSEPLTLPARGWPDAGSADADDASRADADGPWKRPPVVDSREAAIEESGESRSAEANATSGSDTLKRLGARTSRPAKSARAPRLRLLESPETEPDEAAAVEGPQAQRERAEAALLKKLRGRGLSVREARAFVIGLDIAPEIADDLIDEFLSLRYLDDAVLAEQLIYTATSRKGQGRRVIAQSLSTRGIPREIIDAALEEVPDDDDERALEFARSKARSLAKLEPEVALRRLLGQLARRGFGGSSAMRAAKTALGEAGGSSVRFR